MMLRGVIIQNGARVLSVIILILAIDYSVFRYFTFVFDQAQTCKQLSFKS